MAIFSIEPEVKMIFLVMDQKVPSQALFSSFFSHSSTYSDIVIYYVGLNLDSSL